MWEIIGAALNEKGMIEKVYKRINRIFAEVCGTVFYEGEEPSWTV